MINNFSRPKFRLIEGGKSVGNSEVDRFTNCFHSFGNLFRFG